MNSNYLHVCTVLVSIPNHDLNPLTLSFSFTNAEREGETETETGIDRQTQRNRERKRDIGYKLYNIHSTNFPF